jgi:hypothetical protein
MMATKEKSATKITSGEPIKVEQGLHLRSVKTKHIGLKKELQK